MMRVRSVAAVALVLSMSGSAFAQEYVEYTSRQDRFTATFPVEPKVTGITWKSQFGADLPARVYSAESLAGRFTLTVVDYNDIQAIDTNKAKHCPGGAQTSLVVGSSTVPGYSKPTIVHRRHH